MPLADTLQRIKGPLKQVRFAVVDIESREWVHPYAVGFYDGVDYKQFTSYSDDSCIRQFLNWVLRPKYEGFRIYAHNGGNFDFLFLLRQLLEHYPDRHVEVTPIQSCMFRVSVEDRKRDKKSPRKWTFLDSARLFPLKLNEVGATFGLGHKVETGMSYDVLALPVNHALMSRYLRVDCELLWKSVQKFQSTLNELGGQLQATLPGCAMDLFRRRYLQDDVYVNRHFSDCADSNCKGCLHDFVRGAYFGGRTEIYRMAGTNLRLYDVNSHYPHCMLSPMPVGAAIVTENDTPDFIEAYIAGNHIGIVDCDVEIPVDCYLPPLPVRHGGKLIFPTGRLSGKWDTCELALLPLVGGRIVAVRKAVWFQAEPIFSGYVTRLYKYRDKTSPQWNKGLDFIAKILLNSLYGKFGMNEHRHVIRVRPDSPAGMTALDLESDVWTQPVFVSPKYVIPQISCHVTALARSRLWRLMWDVVQAGGKIYYCDTDSIVTDSEMPTGGNLGQLKLEHNIRRAEFVLPKLYLVETDGQNKSKVSEQNLKIKSKGISPGLRIGLGADEHGGQLSEQEFENLVRHGLTIPRERIAKFKESLREYAQNALTFPRIIASGKHMASQYDKRVVLPDLDTRPLNLKNF